MLVNCEPWSEWISTLFFGFLRQTAMSNACRTTSVVWRLCIDPSPGRRCLHRREEADDTAGVEIDDDGEVGETFLSPDVGDVGDPGPVWHVHVELPV